MLKSLVTLLALSSSALSHAHHDHDEVAPPHVREELLKKWDQEVSQSPIIHLQPLLMYGANKRSGPSPASPALPTSSP